MHANVPSQESLKEKAKLIRKFIKDKCNADISHSHSLELVSQVFGFKDWNTASASSKSKSKTVSHTVKGNTVGDVKKVLEKFPDSATIDFNYMLKIADLIFELDEEEVLPDTEIYQEFSFASAEINGDIVSVQLELENEDLWSPELSFGRSLR